VGFLRRFLGGGSSATPATEPTTGDTAAAEADERAREVEVLRDEQDRLDDLTRRQLRYADHAWQPPAQGGERRADDADQRAEEA
jgi:hypothetical protein